MFPFYNLFKHAKFVQYMLQTQECKIKKKTLTRRRRNKTSYLSILRLPSFYLYQLKIQECRLALTTKWRQASSIHLYL
jgi:hypothetical protein